MNTQIPKYLIMLTLALTLFSGCGDDDITGDSEPYFDWFMFPMSAGDYWVFSLIDTVSGQADTLEVRIIDTTTIFTEKATTWTFDFVHNNMHPDELQFVSLVADTLKFYQDRCSEPYRILILPFKEESSWDHSYQSAFHYTNMVVDYGMVSVPAGIFKAYQIDTEFQTSIPEALWRVSIWISPFKGIVRMEYVEGFMIPDKDEIWELIEYHVDTEHGAS